MHANEAGAQRLCEDGCADDAEEQPTAVIVAVRHSTSRHTAAWVAPSATRMPNSRRRCATP